MSWPCSVCPGAIYWYCVHIRSSRCCGKMATPSSGCDGAQRQGHYWEGPAGIQTPTYTLWYWDCSWTTILKNNKLKCCNNLQAQSTKIAFSISNILCITYEMAELWCYPLPVCINYSILLKLFAYFCLFLDVLLLLFLCTRHVSTLLIKLYQESSNLK